MTTEKKFVKRNTKVESKGKVITKGSTKKKDPIPTREFAQMFETFEEGMNAVYGILPSFKETMDGVVSFEDTERKILEIAANKLPDIVERKNIFWEYMLGAKRGSIKTDKLYAVSWYIHTKYDNTGKPLSYRYLMTITIVGKGEVQESLYSQIKAAGWGAKLHK